MPNRAAVEALVQQIRRQANDDLMAAFRAREQAKPSQDLWMDKLNRLDRVLVLLERTNLAEPGLHSTDYQALVDQYDHVVDEMYEVVRAGHTPGEGLLDTWERRINGLDHARGSARYDGRTGKETL